MPAYLLSPACKDYLWGGQRLKKDFGVTADLNPLAEAWVLSCHPDGPSVLSGGPFAGQTLPDYLREAGPAVLGKNCEKFEKFPLLVKLIDAERDLSIQVHPTDEYALAQEGQYGKTEMWLVLDAAPGAFLYYGPEGEITREALVRGAADGTLPALLHRVPVQAGDTLFIPAGTLHAIGAGVVVAEIQQNSNITYRVFDYNRLGPDGKPRPLHLEKALAAASLTPPPAMDFGTHLGSCPYFAADLCAAPWEGFCGADSFHALLVTQGDGVLRCGGETHPVRQGMCFFLPAGSGTCRLEGTCRGLDVYVPA